ncbi:MAG: BamA/TamA family outer membrane protein [Calditrichaceae bacterium]
MNRITLKILILLSIFFLNRNTGICEAREAISTNNITQVVVDPDIDAGPVHKFLWGGHWRKLWSTGIKVPVLDIKNFDGGLLPAGIDTGKTALYFKSTNGKSFKFEPIDTESRSKLAYDYRRTFASYINADQYSTAHPAAGLVTAHLLNGVGLSTPEPILIALPYHVLPDSLLIRFEGKAGLLYEIPSDEYTGHGPNRYIESYEIFEETENNHNSNVDAVSLLKHRLMDIYLGENERPVQKWKWKYDLKGASKIWRPVPSERDLAFSVQDGFFPWIITLSITPIEGFGENYQQINNMTWTGRYLDRRFLTGIDRSLWDSVTVSIQSALTNELIENAVRKMPAEWYEKEGNRLTGMLKKRRDNLKSISEQYYRLLSEYVSIWTGNGPDYVLVNRLDDQKLEVTIYRKDPQSGEKTGETVYHRFFDGAETKELRLYLQDGDDTAIVRGNTRKNIIVRIAAGKGKDTLIDESRVGKYLCKILPVTVDATGTYFYDPDDDTVPIESTATKSIIEPDPEELPYDPSTDVYNENYEPRERDSGFAWKFMPWFNFTSDDGFVLGGGPVRYEYGFRTQPYVYRMSLLGAYATYANTYRLEYNGEFYSLIRGWRVLIKAGRTELDYNRFFGFGNETKFDGKLEDQGYYKTEQKLTEFLSRYEFEVYHKTRFSFGFTVKNSDIPAKSNTILENSDLNGIGDKTYLSLYSGLTRDTRDHQYFPQNGMFVTISGEYFPELLDNGNHYIKTGLDARFYTTTERLNATLAARLYSEKLWGDYFFFDGAYLGGGDKLLGYSRERFAGDASVLGRMELRIPVAKVEIVFPATFGVSFYGELGRVFRDGESSDKWHNSQGAGAWLSYFHKRINLNFTAANSTEDLAFYFRTEFMF